MAVRVQTKPVRCCAASTVARPQRASGGDLLPRDADPWERDAAAATCSREMPTRGSETSSGVNDHRPRVSHRCRAGAQASPAGPGVTWQPVARVRSPAGGSGSWLRRATLTAPTAAPRPQVVVPSREVSRGGPPRRCRAAGASSDGHMTGRRTELRARYRELMGGWPSRRSRGERAEVGRGLPPSSFEGDGTSARRGCAAGAHPCACDGVRGFGSRETCGAPAPPSPRPRSVLRRWSGSTWNKPSIRNDPAEPLGRRRRCGEAP